MSRIGELIAKRNGEMREITTVQAIEAILILAEIAAQKSIDWAIGGGTAVQIYGFTRATEDADVIAFDVLDLPVNRELSFGGEGYSVEISGGLQVTVDWIVRDDDYQDFYEAALADAEEFQPGLKIITPEWLVILKHLAGRGKDELDVLWLLREEDLVNRDLIAEHLKKVRGRYAHTIVKDLENVFLYADFMKARDERGK
jgi:hypothetical protein